MREHFRTWRRLLSLGLCLVAGGSMSAGIAADAEIEAIEILKDEQGALSLDQAEKSAGWIPNPGRSVDLGFSTATYWLRVRVMNQMPLGEPLFLRLDNALIHDVRFYSRSPAGGLDELRGGFLAAEPYRNPFNDAKFVFPLSGDHDRSTTHYLRVKSTLPLSMRLSLHSHLEMYRLVRLDALIFGAIFGILLLMPVYNTLIFAFSRDLNFLIFGFFGLFIGLAFFVVEGYLGLSFPDFSIFWKERILHFFGAGAYVSLILLVRRLLQSKATTPRIDVLLKALAAFTAVIPLMSLFGDRPIYSLISQLATASIVLVCLLAGFLSLRRSPLAWFFILSSFSFLTGTILFVAQMNGLVPQTLFTTHAVHFGAILQEAFLSFAVAFKINALNTQLQRRKSELEDANLRLSDEVKQREQMEAELEVQRSIAIHSAKLRAVGELAAGIAHQVNNPLAVLRLKLDNLEILLRSVTMPDKDRKMLQDHIEGTDSHITRLAKVTTSLLRMSRNSANDGVSYLPAEHIVEEALDMCRERFTANGVKVTVKASSTTHSLLLKCNATEVAQAVLNLLLNAYDAVVGRDQPWIEVRAFADGDAVVIQVADSGPGVPEDIRAKIMQPFFTTKEHGKGTGVGLSIAQDLVQRNEGKLRLDPTHPTTCFEIRFSAQISRITRLA